MADWGPTTVFIGFGEAGMAFAEGMPGPVAAYDIKTASRESRRAKIADYEKLGVEGAPSSHVVSSGGLILSLVTADNALAAARDAARWIAPGALYCDMNSVAPDTKRAAADAIESAGGRYADVAVMAPVHPQRRSVPLLVSGAHAEAAVEALKAADFSNVRSLSGGVGAASSVKMIRSVIVKGIEALTAECVLAAHQAGVLDEVLASLDASKPQEAWSERANYNLDRMMVHGLRRAAEMEEVVKTLHALGVDASMTSGTVARQRAIGNLELSDPPRHLADKLSALVRGNEVKAA
jgi:3-hydroxyisobutyrate dehydrogenase-like beta-hydroxyacid dehydrogenase